MNQIIYFGFYVGFILAVILNIWIFINFYKQKYLKAQSNLLTYTIELLRRLDSLENKLTGEKQMDEDLKKAARFIVKKNKESIDEATEELKDYIDERLATEETEEPEQDTYDVEPEGDELDDEEPKEEPEDPEKGEEEDEDYKEAKDYEGERKLEFPNEEPEEPKKKGLFRRKKKKKKE